MIPSYSYSLFYTKTNGRQSLNHYCKFISAYLFVCANDLKNFVMASLF